MNNSDFIKIKSLVLILISGLLIISGCGTKETAGKADPDTFWVEASPESQGIDSEYLIKMMERMVLDGSGVDAVFIVRNGYKLFDAYHSPYSASEHHRIYSCTKSVLSTLVGMAIDDGYIDGPEQPVADLFPSRSESLKDVLSPDLKLTHLLTMTTGFDAQDSYLYGWKGLSEIRMSDDWVVFALTRDRIYKPGARFDYSNQASFVIGALIGENTGLGADEYADKKLFKPLSITSAKWEYNPEGIVEGWGGLWLTASDLAKFAWFILQKGRWDGEQLVSESWIETATSPHVTANTLQKEYGYQWWIADEKTIMALGYSGQYAIIVPEDNLVAVFLSDLPDAQFYYPEQMYRWYIHRAVSDKPLPENPGAVKKLEKLAENWE